MYRQNNQCSSTYGGTIPVLSGSLDGTDVVGTGRVCRADDTVERRYAVCGRGLQFKPLYDGHQKQKHLHSRQGLSQANPAP